MKAVVAAFNQEKALVGAFSVITNLRMELFQALDGRCTMVSDRSRVTWVGPTAEHEMCNFYLMYWTGRLLY